MLKIENARKRNVTNEKKSSKEIFALDQLPSDRLQAKCLTVIRKRDFLGKKIDLLEEIVMRILMGEIGHQNSDNPQVLNCWGFATEVPV